MEIEFTILLTLYHSRWRTGYKILDNNSPKRKFNFFIKAKIWPPYFDMVYERIIPFQMLTSDFDTDLVKSDTHLPTEQCDKHEISIHCTDLGRNTRLNMTVIRKTDSTTNSNCDDYNQTKKWPEMKLEIYTLEYLRSSISYRMYIQVH